MTLCKFWKYSIFLGLAACVTKTKIPKAHEETPVASAPRPAAAVPAAKRKLVNPFAVDDAAAPKDGAKTFKRCDTPPAAVVGIEAEGYYSDKSHSVVDSGKKAENAAALKPLRDYLKDLNRMAASYAATRPLDPAPAHCAVQWLSAWARQGALLGKVNNQGGYEQKWALGAASLAYLAVRDAAGQDAAAEGTVEKWLVDVAGQVRTRYTGDSREDMKNNHAYWAGMAVAAAGLAADDDALFRWGLGEFGVFAAQVEPDGSLPLEVGRKARALHYHAFAAQPLVVLSQMAAANKVALPAKGDAGLDKLVALVVKGFEDPQILAKAAGAKQEPLKPADMVFLEFYAPRQHDAAAKKLLSTLRPLKDDRLGGDVTLLFGR